MSTFKVNVFIQRVIECIDDPLFILCQAGQFPEYLADGDILVVIINQLKI